IVSTSLQVEEAPAPTPFPLEYYLLPILIVVVAALLAYMGKAANRAVREELEKRRKCGRRKREPPPFS
ncbi:MAG: hypothetical protein JRC86_01545, partial [Deltaproteobacteria bacterium]|nr:hypothetical protein [Deltaproteobacteria bacterium]